MKVAIPLFENRISPRFDFSPEIWIITVENGQAVNQERLPIANLNLPQRIEQITSSRVDKLICGGIDGFSLNQLGNKGIEVVHDIIGEAEVAFNLFLRGRLRPGFCCERRRGRGFCAWKRSPRGRRI
jgi:predicted Fe-Mo cluster-binding NifX family protein